MAALSLARIVRLPAILLAAAAAAGSLAAAPVEEKAAGKPGAARKANRLVDEKSPYLLQHAHNPVDWYPWGEEAFRAARESGKPIFLSIGYSTCHWCHVMERQSFEDEKIAASLNKHFISIKVDREERPDVDDVYMKALLIYQRGHGGWPLSAFLTPEGKPFFLGTYFPPEHFQTLLDRAVELWRDSRNDLVQSAEQFSELLGRDAGPRAGGEPWTRAQLEKGFEEIAASYDPEHAGFGVPARYAPKFPRTSTLEFLIAWRRLSGSEPALDMSVKTLRRMAAGGIRDHLGGGFHRYSVDREWLVPHFEKMLYDNALIARAALDAHRLTGDRDLLDIAIDALDYVLGRMRDPAGGFHSAEDADSEGEEGKYYVFSRGEVIDLLGEADGALFADRYGITEAGNFEETGKSVLHLARSIEEAAKQRGREAAEAAAVIESGRRKLLEARSRRVPPLKDDKVLADWNGLAISALSIAYQATGERRYLEAAEAAADFIAGRLIREGGLLHRWRENEARFPAYLEGYAFVTAGLLDLYEASLDRKRLEEARRLAAEMGRRFWDEAGGGFFHTGPEHEKLIVRVKDFYDGAIPSGNSIAAQDLIRLSAYDPAFAERAGTMARLGAALFEENPERHPQLLAAAAASMLPRVDVAVVGEANDAAAALFLREVHRRYLPNRTLARIAPAALGKAAEEIPWLAGAELPAPAPGVHALARRGGGKFERFDSPAALGEFLDR